MCEFAVIKKKNGTQIAEEIMVLDYSEKKELLLKDVLGRSEKLDSALILKVDVINQKIIVSEHPLIKDFLKLMDGISYSEIENYQLKLENFKNSL